MTIQGRIQNKSLFLSLAAALLSLALFSLSSALAAGDKEGLQVKSFLFRTDPPGARVYLVGDDGMEREIGVSGKPLPVTAGDEIYVFVLKLQGFLEERLVLTKGDIEFHQSYPPEHRPPLRLPSPLRRVVFRTLPEKSEVRLLGTAAQGDGELLGLSGIPLELNLAEFAAGSEAFFAIRRKGYRDLRFSLKPHDFKPYSPQALISHPPEGKEPLALEPATVCVKMALWLSRYRLTIAVIALIMVPSALLMALKISRMNAEKRKWSAWEALTAGVNREDPMFNKALGGYVLVEKIGQGGMAAVYRAVPEETRSEKEEVAIKVMELDEESEKNYLRRYRREVKILSELSHPNILRILNYGTQGNLFYLITELIRGRTLESEIKEGGIELEAFSTIIRQVLDALIHAHRKEILHRDIKPGNIMIDGQSHVTVMDFGLAKGRHYSAITDTGLTLGTPDYMAPEQVTTKIVDSRTDEYSLGVLAYVLLTGALPFYDESPFKIMYRHVTEQPPPLRAVRPSLPGALEAVVLRMMEKEPDKRYQALEEVKAALEEALARTAGSPPPAEGEER
ncbi:MAG: serine/threonine-protein kinase [Candidatus Eremiobacteraeota bacterium]|nr:serine/threonine-protein kinase [Candidatus Eremiobacteraeota bacterium]